MELEYKWALSENADPKRTLAIAELLGPLVKGRGEIQMRSHYFDTKDGMIKSLKGALRMRAENERTVCCLKLPVENQGGYALRHEFEVEAPDIAEGIARLKSTEAPLDVLEKLEVADLVEECRIEFSRDAFQLESKGASTFKAELSVDRGTMYHEGRSCTFQEMELEFKDGDEQAFHRLAAKIQKTGYLEPQSRSKLERAMSV